MNNTNEIIVGLDIGTTKIACFIGQRSESGKVKILGYGKTESAGVDKGIVINVLDTSNSIKQAVKEASDRADVEVESVYVGVAGQHIRSSRNQGTVMIPPDHKLIQEDDLLKLIDTQYQTLLKPGEEIIHVLPQNYIIDGQELSTDISPVGVPGHELRANFHVVTGNTTNLEAIREAIRYANLKVEGVILEPVASSYAVLDDSDRNVGIALVDIGGGTTDIAIFTDNIIRHTSVLPLAGGVITNDIKESCQVMKNQAEALKTRFGNCLPQMVSENDFISIPVFKSHTPKEINMKTLASIISSRAKMILEQVDYEIKISEYGKQLIGGVVLTGGGSQLTNIKDLASYTLGIESRIGDPTIHLELENREELANGMYSTGIGLVLYGIEKAEYERARKPEPDPEPEPMPDPIEPTPVRPEPEEEVKQRRGGLFGGRKNKEEKKEKAPKGSGFISSVNDYLTKMFLENGNEKDE